MSWTKPTKLTSWSYSRYGTYKQCPLKAKLSYIDKIPIQKNAAMIRGDAIHKMAEKFLKGEISRIPKELSLFTEDFKSLKALMKKHPERIEVEDTWAFRADWSETFWNDWSGCWVRIKTDVSNLIEQDKLPVVIVTDYKTGKYRPDNQEDYLEQLDLYALGALLKWRHLIPEGLTVKPRLVYLDAGIVYPIIGTSEAKVYQGADLKSLQKSWEKRVKPMLNDTTFAPKPSHLCGWCDYSASKGGPCKY
jgi:RecB family exonuclease